MSRSPKLFSIITTAALGWVNFSYGYNHQHVQYKKEVSLVADTGLKSGLGAGGASEYVGVELPSTKMGLTKKISNCDIYSNLAWISYTAEMENDVLHDQSSQDIYLQDDSTEFTLETLQQCATICNKYDDQCVAFEIYVNQCWFLEKRKGQKSAADDEECKTVSYPIYMRDPILTNTILTPPILTNTILTPAIIAAIVIVSVVVVAGVIVLLLWHFKVGCFK